MTSLVITYRPIDFFVLAVALGKTKRGIQRAPRKKISWKENNNISQVSDNSAFTVIRVERSGNYLLVDTDKFISLLPIFLVLSNV